MDKCINCGHESMMPFYQGYKIKKYRVYTKDTRCPSCKSVMCLQYAEQDGLTQDEIKERQVGQPCLSCGKALYQQAYEYGEKWICKSCGKDWHKKEDK